MSFPIARRVYAQMYGPTVGDRVRLADTELFIEIERDFTVYGDEAKFGGGKVLRDGMGQAPHIGAAQAPDVLITNALIVDHWGIVKADIGIKDGLIVAIGKAGNPALMAGVHPQLMVGASTEVIAGEGLIVTPGGIDSHIHFICPQQIPEALSAGITTLIGGGTGPATGTKATTCTPGPWNLHRMLQAADEYPINLVFLGKGNGSMPQPLREQIEAGALGLKLHEDWGTTPAAMDCCLSVAEEYDVQVAIHTDTINEAGFVQDSIRAFKGRTIHTYHTEGAGGGHAPDMLKVCHHLSPAIPEDVAFAESRIRAETIAAEDVLHDLGAISMMSSDSQAMGRIGEVIIRTWQTADKMKRQRGPLPGDSPGDDNARVKRYVAKYTINPAIAHGLAGHVGSVEVGKLADLVVWKPAFFGVKPELVVKGGLIAWAAMGDPNASIPTPQPVLSRPMFGAHGRAIGATALTFVSAAALADGVPQRLGLARRAVAVTHCRGLGKRDMIHNGALPRIEVDPETYQVRADGAVLTCEPARVLPMAQRYFLF